MRAQSVRDQPIIAKVKKKNSLDSLCGHWNTATSHVGSRNPHKTHRTHTHIRTTISVSVAVLHLCFGLIGIGICAKIIDDSYGVLALKWCVVACDLMSGLM